MMSNWLRIVLALVVAVHGLGHVLFLVSLLGIADWAQATQSWLLGGGWLAKGLGAAIWLVAIVGFVVAAVGLFQMSGWWQQLAIIAAIVSIAGLLLFWESPPGSPVISALVFDLLVLMALLLLHWPPVAQGAHP
jgi:hypothetical protein